MAVWPRAAAPRLRSQLPSTSHTRTLGPGQQLFFTRAAVGAESIIIEERIDDNCNKVIVGWGFSSPAGLDTMREAST